MCFKETSGTKGRAALRSGDTDTSLDMRKPSEPTERRLSRL